MALVDVLTVAVPAFVGAIVGAGASHFAQIRRDQQKEEADLNSLRESLWSEMSVIGVFDKEFDEAPSFPNVGIAVFEANADKLGKLSPNERRAVITFYGSLKIYSTLDNPSMGDFENLRRKRKRARAKIGIPLALDEKNDSERFIRPDSLEGLEIEE